jgi:gamma-glutamyl hydrolase
MYLFVLFNLGFSFFAPDLITNDPVGTEAPVIGVFGPPFILPMLNREEMNSDTDIAYIPS